MKIQQILNSFLAILASFGIVISSTSATKADDTSSGYQDVNDDRSTLSNHWGFDHIHYSDLDDENRSGKDTAYLDQQNVTNDALRQPQFVEPTGWHQEQVNGDWIVNRGHEIAYSLSRGINVAGHYNGNDDAGDQNNPKNLFTQTAYSNQQIQTIFEADVRQALESGEKVIYQVTPVFHGSNLMASGVHMQARSTDGNLNFNVYVYNTQPGVKFDYRTGRSVLVGVTNRQNYLNNYYKLQTEFDQSNHEPSNYNYGNEGSFNQNFENNSNGTVHHWSPFARQRWHNTMEQRYWSKGRF